MSPAIFYEVTSIDVLLGVNPLDLAVNEAAELSSNILFFLLPLLLLLLVTLGDQDVSKIVSFV